VLLSPLLSQVASPALFWLTAFAGPNLLQSALTGICLMKAVGFKPGQAYR
jgi:hypothetical protein